MFGNSNNIKTDAIVATSRLSLKISCLRACNNDVSKATELYNYIADGLELPDMEPQPMTGMQKVMTSMDSISNWIETKQPQIEKLITYAQVLFNKQQ